MDKKRLVQQLKEYYKKKAFLTMKSMDIEEPNVVKNKKGATSFELATAYENIKLLRSGKYFQDADDLITIRRKFNDFYLKDNFLNDKIPDSYRKEMKRYIYDYSGMLQNIETMYLYIRLYYEEMDNTTDFGTIKNRINFI